MTSLDIFAKFNEWKEPNWSEKGRVHDWRNYPKPELIAIWHTFTDEQKKIIAYTLDEIASLERWD